MSQRLTKIEYMQNRITKLFQNKGDKKVLSIFFTAGYPQLKDTAVILEALEEAGADMIEIGIPFSDPIADGPTIQHSSEVALQNGMSLSLLFEQLENIREKVTIPLLLMGYLNPVMQYGVEAFCRKATEIGIDGVILPDLPIEEYVESYKSLFERHNLSNILLVTPQTSDKRIDYIDGHTEGFIYVVSDNSTTGKIKEMSNVQEVYFQRIVNKNLKNPLVVGFGIKDHESFSRACHFTDGAIIGSAFIKALKESKNMEQTIKTFIHDIKFGKLLKTA